ncbi:MAG TPA: hypothetical protein VFG42_15860 [Baekduia sp.]|uniref:hypothetical protein n=1 Tax=Baekduia sp. TaxID=2600305 RepID=UPI002D78AA8B|nr:hypothetical protein [Baekduia sp.]HET6508268.1 hypothetical protein [Baekduia sp.]
MAPAFVVGASVTARRFGPRVGGLVGGLPVVGGPILLVLAIVHDAPFARHAASASLLGLISLAAFASTYGAVAVRRAWPVALLAAWAAFALGTLAFAGLTRVVDVPPTVALLAACASFPLAARALPEVAAPSSAPPPTPPAWDLPVRAACAAVLVLAVTGISAAVGSRVSGLIAPAPIITSILAAFTQAQAGAPTAVALLRGMLSGFFAFAAFCWTAAVLLAHVPTSVAFALAALVALVVGALRTLAAGRA